jgi:hypothetical protein
MIQPAELFAFGFTILLGSGVAALGKWMIRRPERLEEVVWPDPKPLEMRNLTATKRTGGWLVFLGLFLPCMTVGIGILSWLPISVGSSPIAFPLVLVTAGFVAYSARKVVLGNPANKPTPKT